MNSTWNSKAGMAARRKPKLLQACQTRAKQAMLVGSSPSKAILGKAGRVLSSLTRLPMAKLVMCCVVEHTKPKQAVPCRVLLGHSQQSRPRSAMLLEVHQSWSRTVRRDQEAQSKAQRASLLHASRCAAWLAQPFDARPSKTKYSKAGVATCRCTCPVEAGQSKAGHVLPITYGPRTSMQSWLCSSRLSTSARGKAGMAAQGSLAPLRSRTSKAKLALLVLAMHYRVQLAMPSMSKPVYAGLIRAKLAMQYHPMPGGPNQTKAGFAIRGLASRTKAGNAAQTSAWPRIANQSGRSRSRPGPAPLFRADQGGQTTCSPSFHTLPRRNGGHVGEGELLGG